MERWPGAGTAQRCPVSQARFPNKNRQPSTVTQFRIRLLTLLFLLLVHGPLPAGEAGAEGRAMDLQELESLVATLEDEAAREALLGQLRALIDAQRMVREPPKAESFGARLLDEISGRMDAAGSQLAEGMAAFLDLPAVALRIVDLAADAEVRSMWLEVLAKLVLILALGLLAEWIAKRLLRRPRLALEGRGTVVLPLRALLLVLRIALDLVAIGVFAAAAYAVLPLTQPRPVTQLVAIALINASVLARAFSVLGELVFASRSPGLRLLPVGDETAHYGHIWVRRLSIVGVYGYFAAEAALLLGLSPGAHALLVKTLGLVIAAMLAVLIMQNRQAVNRWLRGRRSGGEGIQGVQGARGRLADTWHMVAILYVLVTYGVWALEVEGGFQFLLRATVMTVVILVAARLVLRGLKRTLNRSFRLGEELKLRFPGLEERANRYLHVGHRFLSFGVYLFAALALLDVWGARIFEWLASETGKGVSASVVSIVFILVMTLLVWELVSAMVQRYLEERDADGQVVERSARAKTLLPLFRNAVRILLAVIATLMVLAELGINITPLLAGAGVVGLAVGFGAQSLVKDLITGVFILMEDSVAVGDVVDLGGHAGVVESLTVRTIRLRDLTGTVHVLPWGQVSSVLNMTKDFSFALMDVGVAYREDVDEVIEVLKEIGADLQQDPEYGPVILEPLEVLGLDSFGDSSVNIRIRFKTLPIKQWWVRREFNRRMKRVFDQRGIEIPFPHRTLYFGVDKAGMAPPAPIRMESSKGGSPPEPSPQPGGS